MKPGNHLVFDIILLATYDELQDWILFCDFEWKSTLYNVVTTGRVLVQYKLIFSLTFTNNQTHYWETLSKQTCFTLFPETCFCMLILTTNLAACVSVQNVTNFCPSRSHFDSKRPEFFFRIAKFPYAAFGPLFAFHCPLFFTRNNDLEFKLSSFAAVDRRSVADKQLNWNGIIHSASVAQCQELSAKT